MLWGGNARIMEGIVTCFGSNYKITYSAPIMNERIFRRREDVKNNPTLSRQDVRMQNSIAGPSSYNREESTNGRGRGRGKERSPIVTTTVRIHEDQEELLKRAAERHGQSVSDEIREALVNHFRYLAETDEVIRETRDGIFQRRKAKIQRDIEEEFGS